MKLSKRKAIKLAKQRNYTGLINKRILNIIIANSNICKHAIRELELAGYNKNYCGPNKWMYDQVLEAIAVFASHGNSGSSAPYEINLVRKLCNFDIISPLTFKDNEWRQIGNNEYQNKRKSSIFKDTNNIYDIYAFSGKPINRYIFNTKQWKINENPICWNTNLFEVNNGILTGKLFKRCNINNFNINNGYIPKETVIIECDEIEIAPDNFIMTVESTNNDLIYLGTIYDIQWKYIPFIAGLKSIDMTIELENKIFNYLKNN